MQKTVLPVKYRKKLLERFLRYVILNTTSNSDASEDQFPTTACQLDMARMLVDELRELGVSNVCISNSGYVYGTIPENLPDNHLAKGKIPVLGLMSHMDTSQAQSGESVKPQIIANYHGQDITYPDDPSLVLKVSENLDLLNCKDFTIITAGGKTLLGADDKAGIAEIMTVAEYLICENLYHGEIRICFNPDEEVGRGTDHIDLEKFAVQYAFTLDGSKEGEIEDECFNARSAKIVIEGLDVHPGYAKGKMVSAFRVFAWIVDRLPEEQLPENTEERQPYRFPHSCPSIPTVEKFEINFLLRAFTEAELEDMEAPLHDLCHKAELRFPGSKITITIKNSYKNMKTVMDRHPLVMELLEAACRAQDVIPIHKPIRGGTDGSSLTIQHHIPTPNIWAGGMNFHSRLEWVPLEWMVSAAETTLKMLTLWVERYRVSS
ncbi:MAG: peptidase T [Patescibacteria group bacterium]